MRTEQIETKPANNPDRGQEKNRTKLTFLTRPKVTVTDSGLQLEVELLNSGPASVSGSVRVTYKGKTLRLSDPEISMSAGDGPVTLTYDIPLQRGISKSSRLKVTVVDQHGRTLTAGSTGVTAGATLATVAGVSIAGLIGLAAINPTPPPTPPPTIPTVAPVQTIATAPTSVPATVENLAVNYPTEFRLRAAELDDDRFYPYGRHDDIEIVLGPETPMTEADAIEFFGASGGSLVRRSVAVFIDGQEINMGEATLPQRVPTEVANQSIGQDPVPISDLEVQNVSPIEGQPMPSVCLNTESGEPMGGYFASGAGTLVVSLMISFDVNGELTGTAEAQWAGTGQLEYFSGIDQELFGDEICSDVFADVAQWT